METVDEGNKLCFDFHEKRNKDWGLKDIHHHQTCHRWSNRSLQVTPIMKLSAHFFMKNGVSWSQISWLFLIHYNISSPKLGTIKLPLSQGTSIIHSTFVLRTQIILNYSQFINPFIIFCENFLYLTYNTKNGSSKDSNQGKCFHPPHEPPWSTVVKGHGNDLLMVNFKMWKASFKNLKWTWVTWQHDKPCCISEQAVCSCACI